MQYYIKTLQYFNNKNYNPKQIIWNKIGESSKIGQGKKSLSFISIFACFLTAIVKV